MAYPEIRPESSASWRAASPRMLPDKYRYAEDHAPIFYLHPDDRYRPIELRRFLEYVRPQINFKDVTASEPLPDLADLDELNYVGGKRGQNIYLTIDIHKEQDPSWIDGAKINSLGGTDGARTGAIVIVEKGEGVVDVFYFIFWAFNYGGVVLNQNLGNHVGDWEHVMIRFKRGKPKKVWLSQHANGETYTFKALQKYDKDPERPVLYIANGSHAIYAREGDMDHTVPNFNTTLPFLLVDRCKAGQKFDPLLTSYVYSYDPALVRVIEKQSLARTSLITGKFRPLTTYTREPGWLYFNGRWGDREYLVDDDRQKSIGPFHKFVDGPTGPAFKQLVRQRVWPENSHAAGQLARTSLDGSTRVTDQLKEWYWRWSGRKKRALKVMGQPKRVYTDGTDARERAEGKDVGVLVRETEVNKA